jgi:hypothetical protein
MEEYGILKGERRELVSTREAARYLGRCQETLRTWARGLAGAPIRPVRIGGRYAWRVADIRALRGE